MPNNPATLPEILAHAKEHDIPLAQAFRHFVDIGRIPKAEPPPPIPDGWSMPAFHLEWTQEAIDRANLYATIADAEKAILLDLELLFLDRARRRGGRVKATDFVLHTVPMPGHGYDEGFVLSPINESSIRVEPAEFVTIDMKDFDVPIQVPDVIE